MTIRESLTSWQMSNTRLKLSVFWCNYKLTRDCWSNGVLGVTDSMISFWKILQMEEIMS